MDIKELYKSQEAATFQYFQEGQFWYQTDSGFLFPVPLEDFSTARLLGKDKATLFVRYIRKHLADIEAAKLAQIS